MHCECFKTFVGDGLNYVDRLYKSCISPTVRISGLGLGSRWQRLVDLLCRDDVGDLGLSVTASASINA